MATIAIGDIHGNLAALDDLLSQIRGESAEGDTVVFLGDYIDRGPDSKGCVDAILGFMHDVRIEVVCLLGNHEEWFLRTLHDYRRHSWLLGMEAYDTIQSYSADAASTLRDAASKAGDQLYDEPCELPYNVFFDCVPAEHVRFFRNLRPGHQTADCLCTHGGLNPRIAALREQTAHDLVWGAGGFPDEYQGVDLVVYGHRNNATLDRDGWPSPRLVGNTIGIDTISRGVLTAVRLPDQRVFQSGRYEGQRR
jgi:serine/threonine protein phosphatase 1